MLLPEDNFGTQFQHMMPFDTRFMKVNPGIHLDGIQTLFKNVFGSEVQVGGDLMKENSALLIEGVHGQGYGSKNYEHFHYHLSSLFSNREIWLILQECRCRTLQT